MKHLEPFLPQTPQEGPRRSPGRTCLLEGVTGHVVQVHGWMKNNLYIACLAMQAGLLLGAVESSTQLTKGPRIEAPDLHNGLFSFRALEELVGPTACIGSGHAP